MAILKEIEVYVTVNGQVLQEYVDNEADDPPDSFTRYIEAHSDFENHRLESSQHVKPPKSRQRKAYRDLGHLDTPPEKALKGQAISHRTSLGETRECSAQHGLTCEFIDSQEHPWMTFEFRYRSRKALQDMLILLRSPTPTPNLSTEGSDDEGLEGRRLESLGKQERLELVKQRSTAAKLKRETGPDDTSSLSSRPRIKQEDEVGPAKKRRRREPEVIELLDD